MVFFPPPCRWHPGVDLYGSMYSPNDSGVRRPRGIHQTWGEALRVLVFVFFEDGCFLKMLKNFPRGFTGLYLVGFLGDVFWFDLTVLWMMVLICSRFLSKSS